MRFVSTRGQSPELGFQEAVATGLAPDGGLYVPQQLPHIAPLLDEWASLDYIELSKRFFALFATDMEPGVINGCIERAYTQFSHAKTAPLVALDENLSVLELFHGPTLAFKDFALQLLGNLYEAQIERTGEPITVLGATSGDTGAAAIHGLLGKKGVTIFILYPNGGVSRLQERQMTCTGADNVYAIGIDGTFDDAQTTIKALFGDLDFRAKVNLSAVNSINLARILAQCVYYIYAWLQLPEERRSGVEFIVPTGNFGNVLAGWWAGKMGLPVERFCIATNQNDILYRLFTTGDYRLDTVRPSHAPSMDIQIASNFERFLYYHENGDAERVRQLMEAFKAAGHLEFTNFDKDRFTASRADDAQIKRLIAEVNDRYGYVADPHTACGFAALADEREGNSQHIILATAHPAKFPDVIEQAIKKTPTAEALEVLKEKSPTEYRMGADPATVRAFIEEKLKESAQ
jgi:threonine synthase